jgi:futalosine hydrolase
MKILLVSATIMEIRPLLDHLVLIKKGSAFLEHYRVEKALVDILFPGVGMVATAYHLGKHLASSRYDIALNAGICGSYGKELAVGSVVQVTSDRICEMGAEDREKFTTVFDLGLVDKNSHPYNNGILSSLPVSGSKTLDNLKKVQANTVNTIHENRKSIERIKSLFPAGVESMEGSAFFYSCISKNIPCAQIRAVSNFVDERALAEWDIKHAVKNLNLTLKSIIEEIAV